MNAVWGWLWKAVLLLWRKEHKYIQARLHGLSVLGVAVVGIGKIPNPRHRLFVKFQLNTVWEELKDP